MQRFEGKVALVTGAARGIGRGMALCLAEEGANIIVNDLPPAEGLGARGTVREIEALGRRALAYDADISDREQVAALFAAGVAHFGRIDVVVANAAFSIREPVIEAQWEHVLRTLEVTQFGVYHTCQAAAQQMVKQGGGGKIVIIGSILGEIAFPNSAAYNMAKAAVNHLGRTLAAELAAHRINVNVDQPRLYRYARRAQIRHRGADRSRPRATCPGAGWARRATSAARWPTSPATTPTISPAARWWWMADISWPCACRNPEVTLQVRASKRECSPSSYISTDGEKESATDRRKVPCVPQAEHSGVQTHRMQGTCT